MSVNFVHLHTHSEFSLLDGAARIEDLVLRAKELGMPALALTDHGVMYGVIDFYEAANKHGIKPIIGCEVYVAPRTRFEKSPKKADSPYHLVLLAEDNEGYRNLMHLVTHGFFEGFYYKPRVDKELLEKYHRGLIALSGCLTGEVVKLIEAGKIEQAKQAASNLRDIYGDGNFFLEIQDQGLEEQSSVNEHLIRISSETGIPLVATNDVHYTNQLDSTAHDVLLCIQTGSTLEEKDRLRFRSNQFYLKSSQEMEQVFPDLPQVLKNSLEIAERCNVTMELGKIYLPHYEVPPGYDLDSYLEKLCLEGVKKRYSKVTPSIMERLKHELEVIKRTGFSGYFLVVWDFVKFAKEHGIKVGPGRGSAAGSIVAYVLGITNVDPLRYGLLFERFLNPERVSMPDIDIDFCYERRDEVIEYVAEKYGRDKVAQIITFGTMAARAATRDAGRVFGIPYGKVDKIAKLIPDSPSTTIEEALRNVPELRQECESDETTRRIIDTARTLEGLARQDSIHAAGVVISRDELTNYTPLQRKGTPETITQYHMDAIKRIGLLKMDFLGLRTLSVIDNAVKIIKRTTGNDLDIDDVSLEDSKTLEMLRRGESIGVFQLESTGMRSLLKDLQPTTFEDIINILALYRPGPLGSNMVQDFVDRKHDRKPISYVHPSLESILKDTYGIIVYQEQVMRIASELAGFSMAEADILRAAMSKKKPHVLAEQREKFVKGAKSRGIDAETAQKIFDLMAYFAGYGFNRAHSAAYAVISYQTAYLKANYPVEYMAALLTSVMGNKDKVAQYVNECRRLGIKVLPPDVNESFKSFTVIGETRLPQRGTIGQAIRFGLSAVRNVGSSVIDSIIQAREKGGSFKSIYDFCERVDLTVINKRALESLIKGGAFDSCGDTRKHLLSIYERAMEAGLRKRRDREVGQFTFFDLHQDEFRETSEQRAEDEFSKEELLAHEKEMLGLYVSDHPLLGVEKLLRNRTTTSIGELREQGEGGSVRIGGIITRISRITTRRGEIMAFLTLEDLEGSVEVVLFPTVYQKHRELLKEDRIIEVKGRVDVKEEDIKVIGQEVEMLNNNSNRSSKSPFPLCIKLPLKSFNRKLIDQIKEILETHPGSSPVYLQLTEENKTTTFRLGVKYRVKTQSSLFAELKELLGEDSVFIDNGRNQHI
ncbi:MAG: DNA polymerase III subunit alpha [Actinomycetota bacterium]|nr:DNA polymerase III subunit alpha [Actinomycetota bacterium]